MTSLYDDLLDAERARKSAGAWIFWLSVGFSALFGGIVSAAMVITLLYRSCPWVS